MKRLIGLWLFALGACGGGGDLSPDAGVEIDAAPRCDPATPFGTPRQLAAVPAGYDRLSGDELTLYETTGDGITGSIDEAHRATMTTAFGTGTPLITSDSTIGTPHGPTLTADGLRMIFAGLTDTGEDLYVTTRASTDAPFATPTVLADLSTPSEYERTAFLSSDGEEIWFSRGTLNGGDLYTATRSGDGFTAPIAAGEQNTAEYEAAPVLSDDRLTLYYARVNSRTVQMSHRDAVTDPFPPAREITEFTDPSGALTYLPSWLSIDQCRLYLERQDSNGGGVYLAERSPS